MDRWQAQEQRRLDRASNNPAECHKLRDIRATGFAMRLRLLPVIILCAMANATSGPATSAACSDGMYCGRNLQLCGAHALSDGWQLTRAGDAVVMRIDTTSCMALGQRKSKDVRYVASIEARPPYRSQRMYLSLQDGTLKSLPSFEQHKAGNSYLFNVASSGFSILAHSRGLEAESLLRFARACWSVAWMRAAGRHAGATSAHATKWEHSHLAPDRHSITARVETTAARFEMVPHYVSALVAHKPVLRIVGAHNQHDATAFGFQLFVRSEYDPINPKEARQMGLHVHWIACDQRNSFCGGDARRGAAAWTLSQRSGAASTHVAMPTGYKSTPVIVTSLQCSSSQVQDIRWFYGGGFVLAPHRKGFNISIGDPHASSVLPRLRDGWHVSYVAFAAPVDCQLYPWLAWEVCSRSCGGGTRQRRRTVARHPNPLGAPCAAVIETASCNPQSCPRDCEMARWGAWGRCSRKCGGGERLRMRGVEVVQSLGGARCPSKVQRRPCNPLPCVETGKGVDRACGGTTPRGRTVWQASKTASGAITVDVDTSHCQFASRPFYAASVYADVAVITTIAARSMRSVRVNVWHPSLNGEKLVRMALAQRWVVSWVGNTGTSSGATTPGVTGWKQGGGDLKSLYCKVDTAYARLSAHPKYVSTLLTPKSGTHRAVGGHSLYRATRYNFMVYVSFNAHISPDSIEEEQVAVMWLALPQWQASTEGSPSTWEQAGPAIRLHVNASAWHYPSAPSFVTSVAMQSSMPRSRTFGGSTVFSASASGFTIYLGPVWGGAALDAKLAQREGWRVNYIGLLRVACKVGAWVAEHQCSRTCGGGVQRERRDVLIRPFRPDHGCPALTRMIGCAQDDCAEDCKVSSWGALGPCSATCGGGRRHQQRKVLRQPSFGGRRCPVLSKSVGGACAVVPCPEHNAMFQVDGSVEIRAAFRRTPAVQRRLLQVAFANRLGLAHADVTVRLIRPQHGATVAAAFTAKAETMAHAKALQLRLQSRVFAQWLRVSLIQQAFIPTYGSVLLPTKPVVLPAGQPFGTSSTRPTIPETAARDATRLPPIERVAQLHSVSSRRIGYTITAGIIVITSLISAFACARIFRSVYKQHKSADDTDYTNAELSARAIHIASTPDLRETYGSAVPSGERLPKQENESVTQAALPAAAGVFNFDDDGVALFGAPESGV